MQYDFKNIEKKWRSYWSANETYKVFEDDTKQKFYVLDMFPYPSGSGLHVGHPLGYIASRCTLTSKIKLIDYKLVILLVE